MHYLSAPFKQNENVIVINFCLTERRSPLTSLQKLWQLQHHQLRECDYTNFKKFICYISYNWTFCQISLIYNFTEKKSNLRRFEND